MKIIAVPCFTVNCKVWIEQSKNWSILDELFLWSLVQSPKSIKELTQDMNIPIQVAAASAYRLMRFRLIEVSRQSNEALFTASAFGRSIIENELGLPTFPKRLPRNARFVIERATGHSFLKRDIRILHKSRVNEIRKSGGEVIVLELEIVNGQPPMSHNANFDRIVNLITYSANEEIVGLDSHTASIRDDSFMVINITEHGNADMPKGSPENLRNIIKTVEKDSQKSKKLTLPYRGTVESKANEPSYYNTEFDPNDLVVGGQENLQCLKEIAGKADKHLVILSTFINLDNVVEHVLPILREACSRGVMVHILWGTDSTESNAKSHRSAISFKKVVREDKQLTGRVYVRMTPAGSHAKLLLADSFSGKWTAVVGSCNWLSSPFRSVEVSVILRANSLVSEIANCLQYILGKNLVSEPLATQMAVLSRKLKQAPSSSGKDTLAVISGEMHDQLIRKSSGEAKSRFIVISHRLGTTFRPNTILPGQLAVQEGIDEIKVAYTMLSGPIKKNDAKRYQNEAKNEGIDVIKLKKPCHGKVLIWDEDNIVVTSLNWASASSNLDAPLSEIGLHITSKNISNELLSRLCLFLPELNSTSNCT